ncbi:MAG: zf-HC2 domain-containing protein [Ignavibacteriales bacterium]|nr:zf-HC2 domain-containing protein [Ignavibacteriales bacterium]
MKPCEQYQELFIEALYNELSSDNKVEFQKHVDTCVECSTSYRKLEATLNVMNQRERVEPDETYWKNYWNKLNASLEKETETKSEKRNVLPLRFTWQPAWSYGIAATLLLAVGLYLGKILFNNEPSTDNSQLTTANNKQQDIDSSNAYKNSEAQTANHEPSTVNRQPTIQLTRSDIDAQAHTYLERSKVMLLGLINTNNDVSPSLSRQKKISRTLLHQAADLKPRLVEPDQQRIKQLIDELEVILLQLANFEEQSDLPAIELVKKGVDEKAILLKINMEEMRAMGRFDSTTKKQSNKQKSSL